ncbi:hypothetical protein ACQP1K_25675 [Sphaerimonospora sp. CA-214678]|uniref:hypothetical protein n=1 Tax=Sphaerimonospora sp. CA-214678 TaxID=3240029 RepID=UPI003D8CEF7B
MDLTNLETGNPESLGTPAGLGSPESPGSDRGSSEDDGNPEETGSRANPAGTAELHRYAQALLVHLAADGSAPALPPGVTDVPDYWLAPAIEALVLIMSGKDALEPLALATRLDPQSTTLFLCLALAVCGQGDRIHASWLGTAFGELSAERPVTHGQRALWLAAARGAYGPVGKIFVLRKLDAVAVPAEDERWLAALGTTSDAPEGTAAPDGGPPAGESGTPDVRKANGTGASDVQRANESAAEEGQDGPVTVPPSLRDFPELTTVPEIAKAIDAAARLRRLRERCAEITSAPRRSESEGAVEVTKVVSGMIWAEDEPLAVLRSLIGQGDPQGPMSSLTGHLLHDVRPGGDPHMAALAIYLAAPAVKAAAETLIEVVREPPPDTMTVPILGYEVKLRPEGPDPESLATAEQRLVTESVPRRSHPWPGYLLLSVAVMAFVTGSALALLQTLGDGSLLGRAPWDWAIWGWTLAGLGLVAGACGGHLLWRDRRREQAELQNVRARARELSELAEKAVWALHEYAREAEARAEAATEDLAELTRLLRRGPRAA